MENIFILKVSGSEKCRDLYEEDSSSRLSILKSLSKNDLDGKDVLPCNKTTDVFCLMCLQFPYSSEESEPLLVAAFLNRVASAEDPLPQLTEQFDNGLLFCAKTLVSLALFNRQLKSRWERRGYPTPDYYRKTAVGILKAKTAAHKAIGSHHEAWENYLGERLR